jgi:threonylcarbamoyladenosine tRNA methylthiotransferase MtaB
MKVYLDSIGCRLNQAEIERYAGQFRAAGHTLTASLEEADLVVVNTCAVTTAAESDSRQKIRQAGRAGVDQIVVTGCWSTLNPQSALALPGVRRVVANEQKDGLVNGLLPEAAPLFDLEPVDREPIPGARMRTRAFIKAQDGCDNHCTFCITRLARGPGRSRPLVEILADVHAALAGGAQEIVLTGVHLGAWGQDLPQQLHLKDLVTGLFRETDTPRVRLSSLEPWDLTPDFFDLWHDRRLCRHLHLPLQSGSAATLRRMARRTTPEQFFDLVSTARAAIPEVAITTDLIAGFPGETEAEFSESLEFVDSLCFADGHVFTYSPRPGTAAARLPSQVAAPVRKERNACLRAVLDRSAAVFQAGFVGHVRQVLWESATALDGQGWHLSGLTDNYLRVNSIAPYHLWNRITPVYLSRATSDGLEGQIVVSPP